MSRPLEINYHDEGTIPATIKGHRTPNQSASPVWPQPSHCCLCSPVDAFCATDQARAHSLMCSTQLLELKDADWTHYAVFYFLTVNCSGLNGNLIRMQPLQMCSAGAILMLMRADTVSTRLVRQRKTLARPPLIAAGFPGSSLYQSTLQRCRQQTAQSVSHWSLKHLQPAPVFTQHKLLWRHQFVNSRLSSFTSRLHTLFSGPEAAAPSQNRQGPWGQHRSTLKSSD